jgi:hypothetical protein
VRWCKVGFFILFLIFFQLFFLLVLLLDFPLWVRWW